jgi:C4-dicarboxylate-specific signal transduction histidine kinase
LSASEYRDENGEPVILEAYIDITERMRLESQLHQAHKMQAIGTLAGGIAHDFNNILAAILGYTELAMQQMAQED